MVSAGRCLTSLGAQADESAQIVTYIARDIERPRGSPEQTLGEDEKSFGVVGDLGGAADRRVENSNDILADIAADHAEREDGIRAQRLISSVLLGIVCGRQSKYDGWPLQFIKRQRERADDPDDNGRQA